MPRRGSIKTVFHKFIEDVGARVCLFDGLRTIVYVSTSFAELCGHSVDEMLGKTCYFNSESELSDIAPLPEVYDGKIVDQRICSLPTKSQAGRLAAKYIPLEDALGEVFGVLTVVLEDSGKPESPDSRLSDLHVRLQQAVWRMGHGEGVAELVGESAQMRRVRQQVQLAADTNCNAVIVGPTGSGREQVVRSIHARTTNRDHPSLVPLACPLLDLELLNDTVTAFIRRCAQLEAESTPTLLLLDVDELPWEAQAGLLGLLEIQEFEIRILATARTDLIELAEAEKFRDDLAREISTMLIFLPPMSARLSEIPLLAQYFVEQYNSVGGSQFSGLSEEAMSLLGTYAWPGNLAEFKDVIGETCLVAQPPRIQEADLPKRLHYAREAAVHGSVAPEAIDLDAVLADVEKQLLERALKLSVGNKAQAARLLGIHRARLLRRLARFDLLNSSEKP